ncbi:OBAP family protein [Pseudomonas sp. SAICEU22]|uniref:OBAP family protein n=1 Tax=Pseudomonas agronomica TaxID=2979328 RepID=A0ABT3FGC1_9PSED|nr:OBAP family protein [Pseudomonas agronomica]MCW1247565.1 OBAP family protein [Pseudomonas agronomica]
MPGKSVHGTWAMFCAATVALAGCAGGNSHSPVDAPGAAKSPTTATLEAGAGIMQNKPPLQALDTYLDGFHFYNGRMSGQMEAHHYCTALNEEVFQCAIFDANTAKAKLMGVEYIISKRLFEGLPAAEKQLWHSHVHEVKSGQLVAPGIPEVAETRLMKNLVGTYGKTWHTWHTEQGNALPYGVPQLMMGFTADGQVDSQLVHERDRRMGIDSEEKKRARESIDAPAIDPGADAWQKGKIWQIKDPTGHAH